MDGLSVERTLDRKDGWSDGRPSKTKKQKKPASNTRIGTLLERDCDKPKRPVIRYLRVGEMQKSVVTNGLVQINGCFEAGGVSIRRSTNGAV